MSTKIKEWKNGSISIAVEAGKDDMNKEGCHVHIYKRGKRTKSRIPGSNYDLDKKDFEVAKKLFVQHVKEIEALCRAVKEGKYDR